MLLRIFQYFCVLTFILTITSRAAEIEPEKIQVWPEHTNFYGSPNNYYYIASINSLNGYSQSALPVLSRKLKGSIKIFSSPHGNYWAAGIFEDKMTVDYKLTSVNVYTPSGNKLYSVKNPKALKFVFNDRNSAMVGIDGVEGLPQADLVFYDENGQETGTYSLTEFTGGAYCASAEYFLAHSAENGLYVFTPGGELLYNFLISPYYGVSPDGCSVLSVDGGRMNFHNRDAYTSSINTEIVAPKSIRFAPDNKSALILTKRQIYCYSLPDLRQLWEYACNNKSESFSSLSVSPDSRYVAVGITIDSGPDYSLYDRYNTGRVEVLDSAGSKLVEGNLEYTSWSAGYPKVEFSSDSRKVWILAHYELFQLILN